MVHITPISVGLIKFSIHTGVAFRFVTFYEGKKFKLSDIVVNQMSNTFWEFLYEFIQLLRENLWEKRIKVHATISKGNLSIRWSRNFSKWNKQVNSSNPQCLFLTVNFFPNFLKSRNHDLKTPHKTFGDCRVHFYSRNSCIAFYNSFIMFANYQLAFKDSIHLYSQVDQKFMLRWMEANVSCNHWYW